MAPRKRLPHEVSGREREIIAILARLGPAGVTEVQNDLRDPPGYSAVRTMLSRLERKGYVAHREDGTRFVYALAVPEPQIRRNMIDRIAQLFFKGSRAEMVLAVLDDESANLPAAELDRISSLIARARRRA